jgi:hypothetical protein
MEAVRRDSDGELCGHVEQRDGTWFALAVFGAELGRHDVRDSAVGQLLSEGLACLAERWTLKNGSTGEEEIVCIQEANTTSVTLALGYYSMPGVPTLAVTRDQLIAGEWVLLR